MNTASELLGSIDINDPINRIYCTYELHLTRTRAGTYELSRTTIFKGADLRTGGRPADRLTIIEGHGPTARAAIETAAATISEYFDPQLTDILRQAWRTHTPENTTP